MDVISHSSVRKEVKTMDEKCDIVIKAGFLSVVYASPFSGKTYKLDSFSEWRVHNSAPPAAPPGNLFNWDIRWDLNSGARKESTEASTMAAPTTTEASTTVSSSPNSQSGHFGHHKIDVNWSYAFNHGGSASTSTSSTAEKDDDTSKADEVKREDDDENATKNGIDPTSSRK